ncbi:MULTISPECIES: NTP transferase domain-containing protein [unclassified Streptomyces]|uniref:NTP transferase domain-containing protein n=1 Tax=unclassified Streptomyces TaxID=2593676 RepID=UPI0036E6C2EE
MDTRPNVIIAAGGLGSRVAGWSRYLPKEFRPVKGRPGLMHVLDEAATARADRIVVVHHPYYNPLIQWARHVLNPGAQSQYDDLVREPNERIALPTVEFVAQHGPYADITSVLNGAEHLGTDSDLLLAFADNVDTTHEALSELASTTSGKPAPAVLAAPFSRSAASSHGVIICDPAGHMVTLVEKPGPDAVIALLHDHGRDSLRLLLGRARLTGDLVRFLATTPANPETEPKLSLALASYAQTRPIEVITTTSTMIDLGAPDPLSRSRHQ